MKKHEIKKVVKKHYSQIAKDGGSCCSSSCSCGGQDNVTISKNIGYRDKDIDTYSVANLGLGCGSPTGLGEIKKGETVLDLGSGSGFDCFLAAEKTGNTGKVIGVDMTKEMINLAKSNAKSYGAKNVEFKLGEIEKLPINDNSIDVIISNCVINLSPDKPKVFQEALRVLKPGGRIYISDIVLLKELTKEQREDEILVAGCVGGALLKEDYIQHINDTGFKVKILSEDKSISKKQYQNLPVESIKLEARKGEK